MLQRVVSPSQVVTYVSPLLQQVGVPHAFSTRIGGGSPPPFDSLNLGNPNGCKIQDARERIRENYVRLLDAAGCADRPLTYLHQVHGGTVVRLRAGVFHDNDSKGDALISDDPSRSLSVRVADCVPILLSSEDGRIVAAVHAGWRGVIAGVAVNAIGEMNRIQDVPADRIIAAIGPSIGFDAFEVGAEVLDEFARVFGPAAPTRRNADGKGRVDLRDAIHRQFIAGGVLPERIDTTDRCTFRDSREFYSHRRDQGVTGRMAAIIATATS
jgi:YfiH family protein